MISRDQRIPASSDVGTRIKTSLPREEAVTGGLRRVLYLTDLQPSDKFGSLEEQIFTLARAFNERDGLFVPVFGAPVGPATAEQYRALGLHVEALDLHQFSLSNLRRLLGFIRRYDIELVHWNFYNPLNPYVVALTTLRPSLKHFMTDHNSRIPSEEASATGVKRVLKRFLLRQYERVFCISDFVLHSLSRQGVWSNLARCTYFINTERFQPDPQVRSQVRESLQAGDKFVVLFVAHLIRWKGGDVLLRALAELPESIELWVIGQGVELSNLQALASQLGLNDRVRFLGNQRNVEPYMQAADCFACPSIWEEATGLVNLEALGCQLPVIASSIGGIPEFVADGQTGLLFSPGDHRELAQRILQLASSPEARRQMGLAARRAALERFSIERRLPEYVELYRAT
jgi:glycosyltransferase involved in cell wall biosynthesis